MLDVEFKFPRWRTSDDVLSIVPQSRYTNKQIHKQIHPPMATTTSPTNKHLSENTTETLAGVDAIEVLPRPESGRT